ncbi:hypothetical protein AJY73_10410 [Campylobacter jejuni]|uniref:hypothetical protein n=1 Tax=Campylobacter jejuni TaxID=197 RepID=UPI000873B411|nr:hypothetical protein [Campylobacter jejuni]EEU7469619.1 hypothetical protein [Campylobacter jejuni]OEV61759.1 hypothetical protein AJY73_10410 [Campylobacter jejuni]HDZ4962897.1 hypothetical protein [Campylobacter jejuni]HDZ4981055.1 hypothetical protein [Campylobacter jejuni]
MNETNLIEIKKKAFHPDLVNVATLTRLPVIGLLSQYWNGEQEDYINFLKENNIIWENLTINNFNEIIDFSNNAFNKLKQVKGGNFGQFDFRLASILKPKFLKDFNESEFQLLEFNLSDLENEEIKDQIKKIFNEVNSKSFIELKEIQNDKLYLTISRKGMVEVLTETDNGDNITRLSIATARDRITMKNDFLAAKDNNYILSNFILEMCIRMQEIGLSQIKWMAKIFMNSGGEYELKSNTREIIEASLKSQKEKEEKITAEKIRKEVQEELKQEKNQNRFSLAPDSNSEEIEKAKIETRFNQEFVNKINTAPNPLSLGEEYVMKMFDEHHRRVIERMNQKLQQAKEKGPAAYETLRGHIGLGLPIMEALNKTKEQYREEEIVMFASLMLTKDIINVVHKDNKITNLKLEMQDLENSLDKTTLELAKKDNTIKELQGTVSRKTAEMNSLKNGYEDNIAKMEKDLEDKIAEIQREYALKIDEANKIIDDQARIIDRLSPLENQNKAKDERIKELENKYEDILNKRGNFENEKVELNYENKKLKEENQQLRKINSRALELEKQNIELSTKEQFLNQKIADLEKLLKEKETIGGLVEKLNLSANSTIKNQAIKSDNKLKSVELQKDLFEESDLEFKKQPKATDILGKEL